MDGGMFREWENISIFASYIASLIYITKYADFLEISKKKWSARSPKKKKKIFYCEYLCFFVK